MKRWVKWEDVEIKIDSLSSENVSLQSDKCRLMKEVCDLTANIKNLEDEIRRLKTTTITADDGTLEVKDVTECNCQYAVDEWWEQWVCPKHGYKKR